MLSLNKNNKGEVALKPIIVGVGVIITVGFLVTLLVMNNLGMGFWNKGISGLSAVAKASEEAGLRNYEGKTMKGAEIEASLDTWTKQGITVLIANKKNQADGIFQNYGSLVTGATDAVSAADGAIKKVTLGAQDKFLSKTAASSDYDGTDIDYKKDSTKYVAELLVNTTTGQVEQFDNRTALTKVGGKNTLNKAATFKAFLIFTTNDELIGIALEQL